MRRKRRAPTTQLARAGERTRILVSDQPVSQIRFRATVLDGVPSGRIDVETADGNRISDLGPENLLDATGLISMSVVPKADTAITFVPVERPANLPAMLGGGALLIGALAWTAYETMLG